MSNNIHVYMHLSTPTPFFYTEFGTLLNKMNVVQVRPADRYNQQINRLTPILYVCTKKALEF